ncbi:tRNA dihydrouridine synthase DusB [Candidatus Uhrbacteria bacterium RIFOXYB12_FULL_58_10]|uniref:tRNA-dihydrouridine synthase n=1 Tax=Candidatus Uhrbacteria bacterium RIFOXYB2_FULL_57_15 TaxID=1802422 RepID=A0A1F7W7K7_9BACT|nr:MAG: tRNA dihydrouridine synthase DusB [Candidatus Uhrbacteria bacterium RIFOXYB12_FULL_58_10]OGL98783.1 MAG: tRNA dihydrouridine synthase DusB [Candidatus Uhrbacteria bacterium RIFOXYB2_FULL_57_15]OGL99481.1 MAG: tRNA dihydrouridine synthase DusB [Candidatus Uhrbacteria bacterium RIFOXYC12_FULL_57_11]
MKLDWSALPKPIIALSPMADMTDSAFCRIVKETGESWVVFREMVSSEAVMRGNDKTLGMTDIHPEERPLIQQIFGSDPATMAEAARVIAQRHAPEGFDVNMGCPVYKIVHNFNGAALMKEPELAAKIVRAMKSVISVPLSIKIRLGWSDPAECIEFSKVLEAAGADLITIHGRTKTQGYAGIADWTAIRRAKEAVSIPVLCNGDVHRAELVQEALAVSGCDGILVARGALGNPWIFAQIDDVLAGRPPRVVSMEERVATVKRHLDLHVAQYGERGVVTFRKHLSWYFKGIPGAKRFRDALHTASSRVQLNQLLDALVATMGNGAPRSPSTGAK